MYMYIYNLYNVYLVMITLCMYMYIYTYIYIYNIFLYIHRYANLPRHVIDYSILRAEIVKTRPGSAFFTLWTRKPATMT